ncbi:MAG: hypothetical protein AABX33_09085 [Nanoarchaeota archaeon]
MKCNFTYKHYKEAINLGKKLGFSFYGMHDYLNAKPKKKFIVMRHDIDLSLKHALIMANAEKELGIKSTYFIRTRGIFNPFEGSELEIMKSISKLGHEIGFHYEHNQNVLANFKKNFVIEKIKFEALLNKKIFGAALHRAKNANDKSRPDKLNMVESFSSELGLEYDAYSDIFLKQMKYISDSSFRWREGCMCTHIKKEDKLCILTHPIWWSREATSLVSIIEGIFQN